MLVLFADSWRVHSVPLFRSLVKVLNIILIFLMRNTTCNWPPVSEKNNYNSKYWNFILAEFYIFPSFSKTFMSIVQLSLVSMLFQGFVLAFSLYWIPKRPPAPDKGRFHSLIGWFAVRGRQHRKNAYCLVMINGKDYIGDQLRTEVMFSEVRMGLKCFYVRISHWRLTSEAVFSSKAGEKGILQHYVHWEVFIERSYM